MPKRFFDPTRYQIIRDETSEGGIRHIEVKSLTQSDTCVFCGSKEVIKKDFPRRSVLDMYEGKPIHITFGAQRYLCKECGHTFTEDNGGYPPKQRVTSEVASYIAQSILQDESLTLKKASAMYDISQTYISEAISKYAAKFQDMILSVQACYRLIFYPFEYQRRIRCCVCGTSTDEQNVFLAILPNYAPTTIQQFLRKKVCDPGMVTTVFCDLNPDVIEQIRDELPTSELVINPDNLNARIRQHIYDNGDGNYNEKAQKAADLRNLLKDESIDDDEMNNRLMDWWDTMSPAVQKHFEPLKENLFRYSYACASAMMYEKEEYDVASVINIIKTFKRRNIPFEIMILRMMFTNEAVRGQIKKTPLGHYVAMVTDSRFRHSYSSYCVDITKLKEIYL